MQISIIANDKGNPPGKLADAELHFTEGPLAGLKLIGFGIWERRTGGGRNVTFPARQYSINGERRSFALLRPSHLDPAKANSVGAVTDAQQPIRDAILDAYQRYQDTDEPRTEYDQDGKASTLHTPTTVAPRLSPEEQAGIAIGNAIAETVYGPSAAAHPATVAAVTARLSRF